MSCEQSTCDDPNFIIYFLPCSLLLQLHTIPRHEEVKDKLVALTALQLRNNNICKRSIFISHRWVNNQPDSVDGSQLVYIQKTIQLFDNHEHMFVWIDYACMKQDTPDLPTIHRLNYVLSYFEFFMVVLPASDPHGIEYVQRVWCIYEWLSVLHFKRILILPTPEFSADILKHTLLTLQEIVVPGVFDLMEALRLQVHSRIDLLSDYLGSVYLEDPILDRNVFVSKLQAYKPEDKEYVFDNLSNYFSLLDLLFLHIVGDGKWPLHTITVLDTPKGSVVCHHLNNNIRAIKKEARLRVNAANMNTVGGVGGEGDAGNVDDAHDDDLKSDCSLSSLSSLGFLSDDSDDSNK